MKNTLLDLNNSSILVVGDVMLDRYWYGSTYRISPEAPVPVVQVSNVKEFPGGAANVAMNIATLGAKSYLIGLIGEDHAAQVLIESLVNNNVYCNLIANANYPTMIKLRILSRNQQLIRIDFEEACKEINDSLIHDRIKVLLPQVNVLVLSDYAKGALTNVKSIISLARQSNILILVDPKGKDFSCYYGATLLTPTLHEFEQVAGKCSSESDIIKRGMALLKQYSISALLITRSEHGMTLLQPEKSPCYMSTKAQEVFDVTGAGDTVIAVIASALSAGRTLEESCFLANEAAGVVVGKIGTSTVSPEELNRSIVNRSKKGCRVVNEAQLIIAVNQARQCGEKIVMTNGVFDILHAGHISYLVSAKKLGNRLIVAVNSDASTRRLKGASRPVNTLMNRMSVLSALEMVDWVVSFEEDTPRSIIKKILPDFLVKGGDYQHKLKDIAGSQEVLANGGDVRILNLKEGITTSNIIKKIISQSI
ncbi:bifunctional D-glycero-beta-D-manno-heptose-7-phosphate kinase/D-glycero-beta-D-manno-heptose 1-phosphate adenylyltransferase HldE [Candidatus Erwinia haradaeae]|uniref:Bifunctional protein HldE n=1 Tax=Candidatus Erwinia haradaeae TaxID=1922217 RepID=A0A451DHD6_9GAMM|nr:bifunctional D-glycero-beta-D-manno-heptose-7-phosphate kinase/D-glycero-beta-D-manno-heptose 1-phosphate adenylyltransferase HldE [Candidatus Erwinia haradaeae]VFP86061.1 Bifunctional protein HldE [Candidatus Erwinia haradaeae]